MRRGNYNSGDDFVLEYGELRFTFNERDFEERCEQAALKLGFVGDRLGEEESEDLVNLVVNGEIAEPSSALGEHVNDCWPELVGPSERSLVHWLRRLIFRSAWLDQRVKEDELDVEWDQDRGTFRYIQPGGIQGVAVFELLVQGPAAHAAEAAPTTSNGSHGGRSCQILVGRHMHVPFKITKP